MKVFLAMIALAGACLSFAGCESDVPPSPHTQNTFERGISGHGSLTEPDRSDDPLINEQTRTGN